MNILICSDGTPASDGAAHLGGMLARATKAPVTLLGIVENPADDQPLRQALDRETDILRRTGVPYQTVVQSGEPTAQILGETSAKKYDLIVIGSRRRNVSGGFWQSQRTYEIIKAVEPPVLIAMGPCEGISRILLCSGGKHFIDDALRLTGTLAAALHAEVTLLHVMAEPPAMYAHLIELEEDVDALLSSGSELGRNLVAEKKALEKLRVADRFRFLPCAGSIAALHHGRCDSKHPQVRRVLGARCSLSTARAGQRFVAINGAPLSLKTFLQNSDAL